MIGILIVTHGAFADGLKDAVELIAGAQAQMESIGVRHGDGVEEVERKVDDALHRLQQGDGVLAFVDIVGGTPSNILLKKMCGNGVRAVADVNLPMVVNAALSRGQCGLEELCGQSVEIGAKAPLLLHELYAALENQEDEEF